MDKQTLLIAVVGFVCIAILHFVYKIWSLCLSERAKTKRLASQQIQELAIMDKNNEQRTKDNEHALEMKIVELISKI